MLVNSMVSFIGTSELIQPMVLIRFGTGGADLTDLLLSVEPDNMQAQSLRTLIEQSVTRDGYIGTSRLF
jgi:hypothetical protein